MLNKKNIIIRIDSSSEIGIGHLMRTLILANGLKNYFNIIYLTQNLRGNKNHLIEDNGFRHQILNSMDCHEFTRIVKDINPVLCIIDHYDIDIECEKKLGLLCDVLVFDDEFKAHKATWVLNHSFIASNNDYTYLKYTKIMAGSCFTLLKDSFISKKSTYKPLVSLKNKKVLIALGGSDPLNISLTIKKYLSIIDKTLDVKIVTTSSNSQLKLLKSVEKNLIINSSDMAKLMKEHDLIITSASTSLLETLALKKPFIAIKSADNQTKTVNMLKKIGLKNIIEDLNFATFKKTVFFVKYQSSKIQRFINKYHFYKDGVAKEIINAY